MNNLWIYLWINVIFYCQTYNYLPQGNIMIENHFLATNKIMQHKLVYFDDFDIMIGCIFSFFCFQQTEYFSFFSLLLSGAWYWSGWNVGTFVKIVFKMKKKSKIFHDPGSVCLLLPSGALTYISLSMVYIQNDIYQWKNTRHHTFLS